MTADERDGWSRVLIAPGDLAPFGAGTSYASLCAALLNQQKKTWPLLQGGYAGLNAVQTRAFDFDGFVIKVQFNPGRITSSAAKVDKKSIRERKCFLCMKHLPPEQRGVAFGDDYVILCNPFPIFPEHFTIPHREHIPQRIDGSFGVFLDLAKAMGERYTLFYNGPRCGASAPDHLHFQAGLKGFMPLDTEYRDVVRRYGRIVLESEEIRIVAVDWHLRRFVALESTRRDALLSEFGRLMDRLKLLESETEEPMVNVLASYEAGWRILVFPRRRHRPSFFFEEGEKKMVISPAAVDMGGVCITPVERDFHRIRREDLVTMFEEVTLGREEFAALLDGAV